MTELVLYDNDIILKIAAYQLTAETATIGGGHLPAVLPVAQFSLRDQARRTKKVANRDSLVSTIETFITNASVIEPEAEELSLAANLEEAAIAASVPLDTGESQLVAVLITRKLPLMLTGDKRAVVALHALQAIEAVEFLGCLEQVLLEVLAAEPIEKVRPRICAEPEMDKAVTICFGCTSSTINAESVFAGLTSYVAHLRKESGALLVDGPLSAVIS